MVIENRDAVVAGTKLVATYKKQAYVCSVEAGEDGKLAFIYDSKSYSSPSAAGSAVMGGSACNGWKFWSVEGEAPAVPTTKNSPKPSATTKAKAQTKPAGKTKPAARTKHATKVIHPAKHQEDVPEGQRARTEGRGRNRGLKARAAQRPARPLPSGRGFHVTKE